MAEIFEKMGYQNVQVVGGPGDHDVDITAEKKDEFDHIERWAVQRKRYNQDQKIGGPAVAHLATAAEHEHGRATPCFVTSSDFTDDARERASSLKVRLINGVQLLELAKKYSVAVPVI